MGVRANLQQIQQIIGKATLVAVTKYATEEQVRELLSAGQLLLGESRLQSVQKKLKIFTQPEIQWHMIGHLQTNKVKPAIRIFELIQSVDSPHLAAEISKEAGKINKIQKILIEVNIGREPQKSGVMPEQTVELIKAVTALPNLKLCGLMAMAPYSDEAEASRPYFKEMKKIFDDYNFEILSMGMSGDYRVALEEGSNMVRIGSALFA